MKIVCPSCGKAIAATDIDLTAGRALCRDCSEVVEFGKPAPALTDGGETALSTIPAAGETAIAETRFRPNDLRLTETQNGKHWLFEVRPNRMAAIPLLGFAAVWNAFLVVWYSLAIGAAHGGPFNIMLWFPLLHVGAGIFITWQGLLKLLNRTRVELTDATFKVSQGPLPGRSITEDATQVLRFEATLRGPRFGLPAARGTSVTTWTIKLLTADGRSVSLPIDLPAEDHAGFVAHRLNHAVDENRTPLTYRG